MLAPRPCRNRYAFQGRATPRGARRPDSFIATFEIAARQSPAMNNARETALTKVPEVTLVFWIIKIAATTLGETGGDSVTMTLELGVSRRHRDFLFAACRAGRLADRRQQISSLCSTGRRSSPRRLSARPWPILPTARSASATPAARRYCSLVCSPCSACWYWSQGTISVDDGQHAESRSLLLGGHHLLADARHRAWRLDGGHRRPRIRGRRPRFSAPRLPWSPPLYYWTRSVARDCCSGPLSS